MKAKVLTIISALILIAATAVSIILVINNKNNEVKPANPDAPTAKIESFSYNYGSYHGGYHYYSIEEEDGRMMINGAGGNGIELNLSKEISDDKLEELSRIINDNKIYEWNGFSGSEDGILDGYDFELEIKYKDGKEVKAHGYEEYPNNYSEAHKSLEKYFASFE